MPPDTNLETALRAVSRAMTVCRFVQRRLDVMRAMTKDDRSPVTIADYASQAIVASILRESLGDIRLVGEESAAFLRQPEHTAHLAATRDALRTSSGWPNVSDADMLSAIDLGTGDPDYTSADGFWTLDPIDGTKGFLRGEQYAVCLALIVHGRVELGVLGCPNLPPQLHTDPSIIQPPNLPGSIHFAIRGQGAHLLTESAQNTAPTKLHAPDISPCQPAVLAESVESAHTSHSASESLVSRTWPGGLAPPIRMDSQCKYALVARGEAHAYLRLPSKKGYVERIWDHAAGALIAQEAGCIVTDIQGRPLDFARGKGLEANTGICAAVPSLHASLTAAARTGNP